jgi:hypothetical protein
MSSFDRFNVISSLVGGQLAGGSDGYNMNYIDGQTPPTEEAIQIETTRLKAEYDAQEYARDRAPAYPSVGDQLDMIYKDNKNSTTTHADAVEAVKAKYPKP